MMEFDVYRVCLGGGAYHAERLVNIEFLCTQEAQQESVVASIIAYITIR